MIKSLSVYAVILLAGAVLGIGLATWFYKGGEIRALNKHIRAMNEARAEADAKHLAVVSNYMGQLETNRRLTVKLQQEGDKHVKDNIDCNYTRGAIGLLNYSYTGLPDPAAVTDEEKASTSTITQRAALKRHLADVQEYNDCAGQLNSLIDAISRD